SCCSSTRRRRATGRAATPTASSARGRSSCARWTRPTAVSRRSSRSASPRSTGRVLRPSSQIRSVSRFARFAEQPEAGRLLDAAVNEGPAHAYLFHGPPGVGKREVARAFAHELLGTTREFHPDLYEIDALGEMIRIDAIRELRR